MQYLGKPNQFTGDFGAYAIKKQRVTMESVEKLVRKYYKTKEKQRRMLEIIHRKLDNLGELGEMFSSYSKLYLYEKEKKKQDLPAWRPAPTSAAASSSSPWATGSSDVARTTCDGAQA